MDRYQRDLFLDFQMCMTQISRENSNNCERIKLVCAAAATRANEIHRHALTHMQRMMRE